MNRNPIIILILIFCIGSCVSNPIKEPPRSNEKIQSQLTPSSAQPTHSTVSQPNTNVSLGNEQQAIENQDSTRSFLWDAPIFNSSVYVKEINPTLQKTVLLVHGLGLNGNLDWEPIVGSLKDHRVILFDLPGFGQSENSKTLYSPDNLADLIYALQLKLKLPPFTLVGHSLGGAIALKFTEKYPSQVNKLILVSAAGILQKTVYAKHLSQIPAPEPTSFANGILSRVTKKVNTISRWFVEKGDELPDLAKVLIQSDTARNQLLNNNSHLNAGLALAYEDFSQSLIDFNTPTHLIWGALDRIAPIRTAYALEARLNQGQLHIINNVSHVPMKEATAEFSNILLLAMNNAPMIDKKKPTQESKGDLICRNQSNQVYTGRYNKITIQNCKSIALANLIADSIVITKNSSVTMKNVTIKSPFESQLTKVNDNNSFGLNVSHSRVEATNIVIQAMTPILANRANIDIAGSKMLGKDDTVKILATSNLYFSISVGLKNSEKTPLHGVYILQHSTL